MNPISINGTPLTQQPSNVNEDAIQVRTYNEAVDGSLSVNSFGTKQNAVLNFTYVQPELFQLLKALGDGVEAVTYSNTASNVAGGTLGFTGILSYTENSFVRGGSGIVPLQVTIRQV